MSYKSKGKPISLQKVTAFFVTIFFTLFNILEYAGPLALANTVIARSLEEATKQSHEIATPCYAGFAMTYLKELR